MLSHIWLTLDIFSWKRNRLLLGRPFLVTDYRTTRKSARPEKLVLTFRVWPPSVHTFIFRRISNFISGGNIHTLLKLKKILESFSRKQPNCVLELIWRTLVFERRMFIFTERWSVTNRLLNAEQEWNLTKRSGASVSHVCLYTATDRETKPLTHLFVLRGTQNVEIKICGSIIFTAKIFPHIRYVYETVNKKEEPQPVPPLRAPSGD
jgi:hypothetical protein